MNNKTTGVDQLEQTLKNKKHPCSSQYEQFRTSLDKEDFGNALLWFDRTLECFEKQQFLKNRNKNKN